MFLPNKAGYDTDNDEYQADYPNDEPRSAVVMRYFARQAYGYDHSYRKANALDPAERPLEPSPVPVGAPEVVERVEYAERDHYETDYDHQPERQLKHPVRCGVGVSARRSRRPARASLCRHIITSVLELYSFRFIGTDT